MRSSIFDATPSVILSTCASCQREALVCVCYCQNEVCDACAPGHLHLCAYAQARLFKKLREEERRITGHRRKRRI